MRYQELLGSAKIIHWIFYRHKFWDSHKRKHEVTLREERVLGSAKIIHWIFDDGDKFWDSQKRKHKLALWYERVGPESGISKL
jgi:hypothetical protein